MTEAGECGCTGCEDRINTSLQIREDEDGDIEGEDDGKSQLVERQT